MHASGAGQHFTGTSMLQKRMALAAGAMRRAGHSQNTQDGVDSEVTVPPKYAPPPPSSPEFAR